MTDWMQKLIAQLDKDQPGWVIDWANESDCRDFMRDESHHADKRLKLRIANRIFSRVLSAAISAGIVIEVKDD